MSYRPSFRSLFLIYAIPQSRFCRWFILTFGHRNRVKIVYGFTTWVFFRSKLSCRDCRPQNSHLSDDGLPAQWVRQGQDSFGGIVFPFVIRKFVHSGIALACLATS